MDDLLANFDAASGAESQPAYVYRFRNAAAPAPPAASAVRTTLHEPIGIPDLVDIEIEEKKHPVTHLDQEKVAGSKPTYIHRCPESFAPAQPTDSAVIGTRAEPNGLRDLVEINDEEAIRTVAHSIQEKVGESEPAYIYHFHDAATPTTPKASSLRPSRGEPNISYDLVEITKDREGHTLPRLTDDKEAKINTPQSKEGSEPAYIYRFRNQTTPEKPAASVVRTVPTEHDDFHGLVDAENFDTVTRLVANSKDKASVPTPKENDCAYIYRFIDAAVPPNSIGTSMKATASEDNGLQDFLSVTKDDGNTDTVHQLVEAIQGEANFSAYHEAFSEIRNVPKTEKGNEFLPITESGHSRDLERHNDTIKTNGFMDEGFASDEGSHVEESLSTSGEDEKFHERLRTLRKQDVVRDRLLNSLHRKNFYLHRRNLKLQKALDDSQKKISQPNLHDEAGRAEAAERNLWEAHESMEKNPFVYVLIDGDGYKIQGDLLQSGKRGGAATADRLLAEVLSRLDQFEYSKYWDIVVNYYVAFNSLLARCVSDELEISEKTLREFACGFTQAQPLFDMIDVGANKEAAVRKISGLFTVYVNNVHCKHIFFGCCHDTGYAAVLEPYTSNPMTASRITLLRSDDENMYFATLPFESIELPFVYTSSAISTPITWRASLQENIESQPYANKPEVQDSTPKSPSPTLGSSPKLNQAVLAAQAAAKWQAAANDRIPIPTRDHRPPKPKLNWASNESAILLNVNDERVDPFLGHTDHEAYESMYDRMEERRFCMFYHLHGKCVLGKTCKFRHGPKLNAEELLVLRYYVRRTACDHLSRCRRPDCLYGHVCPDQPGCSKGPRCHFIKVHNVDLTAVRVWRR